MADLKKYSSNFRKDLGDEEKPADPGMFANIMNMITPEPAPQVLPAQAPADPLNVEATDFFNRMKKR